MAGIYLHIPFCKTICSYCDFYKSPQFSKKQELLASMCKELIVRKDFLENRPVETIYFGGGTPSTLSIDELRTLLQTIKCHFQIEKDAEITLEANPDDLNLEYLTHLRAMGINRLSIGIQSFNDEELVFLNRRHNSTQALDSVRWAKEAGFSNLSLDLIYGLPNSTPETLARSLELLCQQDVPHISAYHLTIEQGTPFYQMKKKGRLKEVTDLSSLSQYQQTVNTLTKAGYEQYEVSSYAKNGLVSKHNSHYWKQKAYLGIGPSAHSYNLTHRQWNIAKMQEYIKRIEENKQAYEEETLSKNDQFNDYLMLGLRTRWGIDLNEVTTLFGATYRQHCSTYLQKHADSFCIKDTNIRLTTEAFFKSDAIIADIFVV